MWFNTRVRAVLLALAIVTGCAARPACPTYAAPQVGKPFAWRVTGPRGSLVIQATHQGVDGTDVSSAAWSALDIAQLYITEAEEAARHEEGDPDEQNPLFHLPRGQSLQRMLSNDDFVTLQEQIGVAPGELARLKPWVAFMLLGRSQIRFADPSMNASLLERARFRRLPVVFLETWEDQVSYLDTAITPRKLTIAIRDVPNMACRLTRRLEAFRAGDDAAFANDVVSGEPVVARIERWFVPLREVVDGGHHAFVAVGIGQIVGPYGLLARFSATGYQVRRL